MATGIILGPLGNSAQTADPDSFTSYSDWASGYIRISSSPTPKSDGSPHPTSERYWLYIALPPDVTRIARVEINWTDGTPLQTINTGFVYPTLTVGHLFPTPGQFAPIWTMFFTDGSQHGPITLTPPADIGGQADDEKNDIKINTPIDDPADPPVVGKPKIIKLDLPVPTLADPITVKVPGQPDIVIPGVIADTPRPFEIPWTPTTPGTQTIEIIIDYPDGTQVTRTEEVVVLTQAENEALEIVFPDVTGGGTPKPASATENVDVVIPIPNTIDEVCVLIDGTPTCVTGPFLSSPATVPVTWGTAADSPQTVVIQTKHTDGSTHESPAVNVNIDSQASAEAPFTTLGPGPAGTDTSPIRSGQVTSIPVTLPSPTDATSVTLQVPGQPDIVINSPFQPSPFSIDVTLPVGVHVPVVLVSGYGDGSQQSETLDTIHVVTQAAGATTAPGEVTFTGMGTVSVDESVAHEIGVTVNPVPYGLTDISITWQSEAPVAYPVAGIVANTPINEQRTYSTPAVYAATITLTFDDASTHTESLTLTITDTLLPAVQGTDSSTFDTTPTVANSNAYRLAIRALTAANPGLTDWDSALQAETLFGVVENISFVFEDIPADLAAWGGTGAYNHATSPNQDFISARVQEYIIKLTQWVSANKNNVTEITKMRSATFSRDLFNAGVFTPWDYPGTEAGIAEFRGQVTFAGINPAESIPEGAAHTVGVTTTVVTNGIDRIEIQFDTDPVVLFDNATVTAGPATHSQDNTYGVPGAHALAATAHFSDGSSIVRNGVLTVTDVLVPAVTGLPQGTKDDFTAAPLAFTPQDQFLADLIAAIPSTGPGGTFPDHPGLNSLSVLYQRMAYLSEVHSPDNYVLRDIPYLYAAGINSTWEPSPGIGVAIYEADKELYFLRDRTAELNAAIINWLLANESNVTELDKLRSASFVDDVIFGEMGFTFSEPWVDIATTLAPGTIGTILGSTTGDDGHPDILTLRAVAQDPGNPSNPAISNILVSGTDVTMDWGDGTVETPLGFNTIRRDKEATNYLHIYPNSDGTYVKTITFTFTEDGSSFQRTETLVINQSTDAANIDYAEHIVIGNNSPITVGQRHDITLTMAQDPTADVTFVRWYWDGVLHSGRTAGQVTSPSYGPHLEGSTRNVAGNFTMEVRVEFSDGSYFAREVPFTVNP